MTGLRLRPVVACLVLMLLSACGIKGDPVYPDREEEIGDF